MQMMLHLKGLNCICHSFCQISSLLRSSWRLSQSESSTTTPYKRMSSANNLTVGVRPFGRSLMSSLVALALDLQEVPLSTSHSFARQHMVCFYSSVHCPYSNFLFDMYLAQLRKLGTYFPAEEQLGRGYTSR